MHVSNRKFDFGASWIMIVSYWIIHLKLTYCDQWIAQSKITFHYFSRQQRQKNCCHNKHVAIWFKFNYNTIAFSSMPHGFIFTWLFVFRPSLLINFFLKKNMFFNFSSCLYTMEVHVFYCPVHWNNQIQ